MALPSSARDRDFAADEPGFRLTLAQVREFLPRYRWVIAGVFVLTVASAYVALSLMTELYEARASLLVKLGRENLDAPPTAKNSVLSTGVRREELGSEAQLLHSVDLLAQVVDEVGVGAFTPRRVVPTALIKKAKFYVAAGVRAAKTQYREGLIALDLAKRLTPREQAIALLSNELVIEPQKDADVIGMRLRLADPALAVRVQSTLIDRYLARRVAIRQDAATPGFLDRQAADLRDQLSRIESERNAWKQGRALTVPLEQKTLLLQEIRALSAEHTKTRADLEALTREMAMAGTLIGAAPVTVEASSQQAPNPSFQMLNERLTKLESDRAHLLTTYQSDAATVRNVEEEIANVKALVAAQRATQITAVTSQPNPLRQQLEQRVQDGRVRYAGLIAAEAAQSAQLAHLQSELRQVEQADARLTELERDRQVVEQSYLAAARRRDDAAAEARLDVSRISNVSVVMPPAAAPEPVYPRKLLLMAIALGVGLALGLALAIAIEWTSDEVRDAEQIESLTELVCLGSVSFDRGRNMRPIA
jgi:uncharacterized protein involved in exopolysaccharide biosynthesis